MNRPFSKEDVRILLELHPEPLTGVEESDQEWWLGRLSISKNYPGFRSGHGHPLEIDSRFRKEWFEFEHGNRGWAAIFQAFDPSSPSPEPPEYFAGWVPPDREQELDEWIQFLNDEIASRLKKP